MIPHISELTGQYRSSLAKSLISLDPLLNIMRIIGHWTGIMLNVRETPPLRQIRGGTNVNVPPTPTQKKNYKFPHNGVITL